MKFIVSSTTLFKQLQNLIGVISTSNTLPILDNFLFDISKSEMIVTASDLETTVTTKIEIKSDDSGQIAVPARILLDTIKNLPETPLSFAIDAKNGLVEISTGEGKYRIAAFNAAEYPKIPVLEGAKSFGINSYVLANAITKTIFAAGNDDLRPVMSGVFFQLSPDGVVFVATDAHKLVRIKRSDIKSSSMASFIVPKKPLNLLKNLLSSQDVEVNVDYTASNAFFTFGNINLICRLIDGKYPNYEAVIPKENPNKMTIDRVSFLNSVRRVANFANKTTHQVRLKIAASELSISAEDIDFNNAANERLACQYTGEDIEIGFNSKFLSEMMSNLDTENVNIELSAPNRAGIILPNGDTDGNDILMLVMPVMLNS
jgi:DNA polymerase III subunit beta